MKPSYIDQRALLFELLGILQDFEDAGARYLSQIGENEVTNPFQDEYQIHAEGKNKSIPAEFLAELGIRSVTLNRSHERFALPEGVILPGRRNTSQYKWHNFRNAPFLPG